MLVHDLRCWVEECAYHSQHDGQILASAIVAGTVKLWDTKGQKLQTFTGHSSRVKSVSFSPDGQILASASSDGTVKLWDTKGQELQTLEGHSGSVLSVEFSPDGQTLASSDADGKVILWNLDPRDLMVKSCRWLEDYLTYGNASEEEKALCADAVPLQARMLKQVRWLANVRALLGQL